MDEEKLREYILGTTGTSELTEALLNKPKAEIEFCLVQLMLQGKLDFNDISKAYVSTLENIREDNAKLIAEYALCLREQLLQDRKPAKDVYRRNGQLRSMFVLNNYGKMVNPKTINDRLEYDEEAGRKLCFYEQDWNRNLNFNKH